MDAADADLDVKLQKISADLLADFDSSVRNLLRKPDGQNGLRLRSWVRHQETFRLTSHLLDPFQELPQLLDPYLPRWIPFLSEAYLEALQSRGRQKRLGRSAADRAKFLMPVDQAIARILYVFCKIRGEKVIVRFLNVEARYLELLLSALEEAETAQAPASGDVDVVNAPKPQTGATWSWEQRYVVLLWLSHLFLAPFDLSTISSVDIEDMALPTITGLTWPSGLPGIALRAIPIAVKYLASPGRERGAAQELLVRLAMRRDMQKLGVLDSLVGWALNCLRSTQGDEVRETYFYLGILSFLAGMLRSSADTSDMDKHLVAIFQTVHGVSVGDTDVSKSIVGFALARKLVLKVLRAVVVSFQRRNSPTMESTEMTEMAIGHLLEKLADNDTPVRLAASKSLSIITLKLDPEMAAQVVEAVLGSLNQNVLWTGPTGANHKKPTRDLSAVDSLEWHGLMLTLSHLLYRRSPPAAQLSDIIHALLLGLSFEQKGTSGGSVGANVRDAACFGVWALARRYTTQELLAVSTQSVFAAKAHPSSNSILQVLATELVTTAALDPAGNIRRGASAALQELIGRHPDTVDMGIQIVQTVDYHAVARRSRAVNEVAVGAARLSSVYGEAITEGILGWRGVGDLNALSRRVTGAAFGLLVAEMARFGSTGPEAIFSSCVDQVSAEIKALEKRQVEERHGLLLCFSSLLDQFPSLSSQQTGDVPSHTHPAVLVKEVLQTIRGILEDCKVTTYRRPELVDEAVSRLVISAVPLLQSAASSKTSSKAAKTGADLLSPKEASEYLDLVSSLDAIISPSDAMTGFVSALGDVVPAWLSRNDDESTGPASTAALAFLIFSQPKVRFTTLREWSEMVGKKPGSRASEHGKAYFFGLAMAQPLVGLNNTPSPEKDPVCQALLNRWRSDAEIDTRVAILQSLIHSRLLQDKPTDFLGLLAEGLNDYTTNARGDVGSHVRVEALRAVKCLWTQMRDASKMASAEMERSLRALYTSVVRLAAEKLDRVRPEAQAALMVLMIDSYAERLRQLTLSSDQYFTALLKLTSSDMLRPEVLVVIGREAESCMAELMAGFVTSANTGNEELVISSRKALCSFCGDLAEDNEASTKDGNVKLICVSLLTNLKAYHGQDRVVVPTLEIIAFLFNAGLFQRASAIAKTGRGGDSSDTGISLKAVCFQAQKAGYKTGNIKKILACVKVYGGIAGMASLPLSGCDGPTTAAAAVEARRRLGALMFHPWPRVRSAVVDELWGLYLTAPDDPDDDARGGVGRQAVTDRDAADANAEANADAADAESRPVWESLMGVDWAKADKAEIRGMMDVMGLA